MPTRTDTLKQTVTNPPEIEAPAGLLVVDKPAGWTSHDVVGRVRRLIGMRQVGHAGTLDPMATGVLVLGVGRATRLLGFVGGADKDYTATMRLGVATVSDDADGEVTSRVDASGVTDEAIAGVVAGLTGRLLQRPSAVSAIKVGGVRSYARVRAGEGVELTARPVVVSRFEVVATRRESELGSGFVDVDVEVTVSSGTYIRALARDMGAALGVGGHLTALRRTRVGGVNLSSARTIEQLARLRELDQPLPVIPLADAARAVLPHRAVSAEEAINLFHGRRIARVPEDGDPDAAHPIALLDPAGDLVALAVGDPGGGLRPIAVLATRMGPL